VIMNMLSTESIPLLAQIRKMANDGSVLIWSGILADEQGEAVTAAENVGFKLSGSRTESEWWCGSFRMEL